MDLKKLILGPTLVATDSPTRKITLGFYLIVIYMGVDLFFFIVNLFNAEGEPISLLAGILVSIFCLLLLRWRKVNTAIFLHLFRCNSLAFYFSIIDFDPMHTGSYLYFIPSSLGALAVFGYRERWIGIGFTLLSFVLFAIAIFEPSRFNPNDAHFYLIINFMIILIIGLLIILFFDRMVTKSERSLFENNKELTKANQELDKFVYSASHDLRSPLSSIAGLIELSKKDAANGEVYLKLMNERVQVMDKFINDIIDYSRNSRVPAARESVNLFILVNEVIALTKYSDQGNPEQIRVLMDENFIILSDPARLRVILNNLLSNAMKYVDNDKDELVITITATKTAKEFIFSVEDNGIGIAEDQKDKIFNMFYRASEKATGSGLGLYIVKESLQKLDGTIRCDSTIGKGSIFTVTIPSK